MTLLRVENLSVKFQTNDGIVEALKNLSFDLEKGDSLAIVGESGSGKSQTALSIMGLLAKNGCSEGKVFFDKENILNLPTDKLNKYRAEKIAMIFQDPMTSLNPYIRISDQMTETLIHHRGIKKSEAISQAKKLMDAVKIPEIEKRIHMYPHEFSGGMRQRVMIAMALLCSPEILIADEPTTALDVTVQAQVLNLLTELQKEFNLSLIFISHDLSVVKQISDRVLVLREGILVENNEIKKLYENPTHPYTKMLLASIPRIDQTEIKVTKDLQKKKDPILSVKNLSVEFEINQRGALPWAKKEKLKAVDNISFDLYPGETLGIVGESGCGKSSLARAIVRMIPAKKGKVIWLGENLLNKSNAEMKKLRCNFQMIFQDPLASLNPRMTIGDIVAEPLKTHHPKMNKKERAKKVGEILNKVDILQNLINRYPHELSGGQCQRIGIARALIINPKLIICDEPVSALDVSIQAQVVKLLIELQEEFNLSLIFISHDLSVVKQISNKVMVIREGKLIEYSEVNKLYKSPSHPYTKMLLSSIPRVD